MQNAGVKQLELNWRYLAFDVHPDRLLQVLEGMRSMHFVGLNLTVPHKLLALEWVDELDESARRWGAVNTIRFDGQLHDGSWMPVGKAKETGNFQAIRSVGYNTDAEAILTSIREDLALDLKHSCCVLLGAGGAGRVAALKLPEGGVRKLFLVNRTRSKCETIARELQVTHPDLQVEIGYPHSGEKVDLILNATSLGLKASDSMPWDRESLNWDQVSHAYDMIYQPAETPFLKAARLAGCRTANGLGMLLHQGAAALEIWTGQTPPLKTMREALHTHIYPTGSSVESMESAG